MGEPEKARKGEVAETVWVTDKETPVTVHEYCHNRKELLRIRGRSSFEDVINEQFVSEYARTLDAVVGCRDHDCQGFIRENKNLVAASAIHSIGT